MCIEKCENYEFYDSATKACTRCSESSGMDNCKICTEKAICTECMLGYYLRKDLVGCVFKCADENTNYYLNILKTQCTDSCNDPLKINSLKTACVS